MFTKESTKTAESIRNELKPICEILEKLAKKTQKAANETSKAHRVAIAWQYPAHPAYAEDAGEDSKEIQSIKENSPERWHEILQEKYKIENEKETAEKVAKLNYHNYLLYLCKMLAHLLRLGNTWAQFYKKKGIETLGEFLREKLGARLYIARDGTGWEPFGNDKFYCYFNITIYGACSISGNEWGSYQERTEQDDLRYPLTKPQAPQIYTLKQYIKIVNELATIKQAAENLAKEHYNRAKRTGLIYFIGGLSTPELKAWKMRD